MQMDTGADPFATPLKLEDPWLLDILVLVTEEQPKKISSTDSMNLTKKPHLFTRPGWTRKKMIF